MTKYPEIELKDRRRVFCLNPDEVPIVYQQVQEYLKYGLTLNSGDTVLDVGANIGLFALWLHQEKPDIRIYAFEPIPDIYNVLILNAERLKLNLKAFPFALGAEDKSASFRFYQNATPLSTVYPDLSTQTELRQIILKTIEKELAWLPAFVQRWVTNYHLKKIFFNPQEFICRIRPLSDVIAEEHIPQIDLLKIDVERSEMDVLMGIQAEDWLKIKQVVVEVHNVDGADDRVENSRVEQVRTLLTLHGFGTIAIVQEEMFENSNIFNIYASKSRN